MDLKNTFFGLGSILMLIIILSILGVFQPYNNNNNSKTVIVEKDQHRHPVYYGGAFKKNNVYLPNRYNRRVYY